MNPIFWIFNVVRTFISISVHLNEWETLKWVDYFLKTLNKILKIQLTVSVYFNSALRRKKHKNRKCNGTNLGENISDEQRNQFLKQKNERYREKLPREHTVTVRGKGTKKAFLGAAGGRFLYFLLRPKGVDRRFFLFLFASRPSRPMVSLRTHLLF